MGQSAVGKSAALLGDSVSGQECCIEERGQAMVVGIHELCLGRPAMVISCRGLEGGQKGIVLQSGTWFGPVYTAPLKCVVATSLVYYSGLQSRCLADVLSEPSRQLGPHATRSGRFAWC